MLFAKSADCEVNEANAVVRIPRRKHVKGEAVRLTHLVIPQAEETYEILLTKAFWTYGCEIGVNEYGLAMGEEAVFTTEMEEEKDGIIGPDLMRIGLERARNCQEAIQIMTSLLEQYGQGGSAELKGNSHFDSSFLMSDPEEAYILETAGRRLGGEEGGGSRLHLQHAGHPHATGSVCSAADDQAEDSTGPPTYALPEVPPTLGSPMRQAITYDSLQAALGAHHGQEHLRHHAPARRWLPPGHAPKRTATSASMPGRRRTAGGRRTGSWSPTSGPHGVMAWVTGTSGNCVSIFKPVFLGVDLPDLGPYPTEHFDPRSLWWKHELLHRRAMADFDTPGTGDPRRISTRLEDEFLAQAEAVKNGTPGEKARVHGILLPRGAGGHRSLDRPVADSATI